MPRSRSGADAEPRFRSQVPGPHFEAIARDREGSSDNLVRGNTARHNAAIDAIDDGTGSGDVWSDNSFGTTSGI